MLVLSLIIIIIYYKLKSIGLGQSALGLEVWLSQVIRNEVGPIRTLVQQCLRYLNTTQAQKKRMNLTP